ncbi:TraK family protein [Bartonella sp. DGB2]|uniref:TraK family protein n=1 Tax=Bartonella sp. DGB2 TaxID=3388426 RepID=UPI00398FB7FF
MFDTKIKQRYGDGRVNFLANIETFKRLINAGNTLKNIHEQYEEILGISYKQFARYVTRYIKQKGSIRVSQHAGSNQNKKTNNDKFSSPKSENKRLFFHNPMPDRDKLIGKKK